MEPGMEKTLVVEDTGMGIQAEDLPRVFERGFTGYNGRNDKKSTGLGLYLCKQITEKLSHEMSIQSEEGKGTRVLLDLADVYKRQKEGLVRKPGKRYNCSGTESP